MGFQGVAFAESASSGQESLEPEIVITPRDDNLIKEYRINGVLYMIEITPTKGKPYYLVDADGDGNLETRRNHIEPDILIPSSIMLRW